MKNLRPIERVHLRGFNAHVQDRFAMLHENLNHQSDFFAVCSISILGGSQTCGFQTFHGSYVPLKAA